MFGQRKRREREELDAMRGAREWQAAMWEWQQDHPGVPVMEGSISRDSPPDVVWNGPPPSSH